MFRKILPPLLVLLTVLLDTAVLPVFTNHWLTPMFALLTVHTLGLLLGRTSGTLYGMIAGLMADISLGSPLGVITVFYVGLGYLGGWFGRAMLNHPLAPVISATVGFTIFEVFMALYTALASAAFSGSLLLHALIRILLSIVLVEGLYILYDWLIKPSRSRYMPR